MLESRSSKLTFRITPMSMPCTSKSSIRWEEGSMSCSLTTVLPGESSVPMGTFRRSVLICSRRVGGCTPVLPFAYVPVLFHSPALSFILLIWRGIRGVGHSAHSTLRSTYGKTKMGQDHIHVEVSVIRRNIPLLLRCAWLSSRPQCRRKSDDSFSLNKDTCLHFSTFIGTGTGGVIGPHYASSKSALHGLVNWLSLRYAREGIVSTPLLY